MALTWPVVRHDELRIAVAWDFRLRRRSVKTNVIQRTRLGDREGRNGAGG
jgi:hypothetical protein